MKLFLRKSLQGCLVFLCAIVAVQWGILPVSAQASADKNSAPAWLATPQLSYPTGSITTAQPTYTWSAVSGATDYLFFVYNGQSNVITPQWYSSSQAACNGQTCSLTPSALPGPGTYYWWVQARSGSELSAWSVGYTFSYNGASSVPPPPTLQTPEGAITMNVPVFTWSMSSGATQYLFFIFDGTSNVFVKWYSLGEASCNVSTCSIVPTVTLNAGAYTWWVQAKNDSGVSAWSNGKSFTVVSSGTSPARPFLISPNGEISTSTPTFTWNAVNGATDYLFYINGPTGDLNIRWITTSEANCNASTCSYTPQGILADGSYYWFVKSKNQYGESAWSDSTPINPDDLIGPYFQGMKFVVGKITRLPAPAQLSPLSGVAGSQPPLYVWQVTPGATFYQLRIADANHLENVYWVSSSSCNEVKCDFQPEGLNQPTGTSFTWRIAAWNRNGLGEFSPKATFQIP